MQCSRAVYRLSLSMSPWRAGLANLSTSTSPEATSKGKEDLAEAIKRLRERMANARPYVELAQKKGSPEEISGCIEELSDFIGKHQSLLDGASEEEKDTVRKELLEDLRYAQKAIPRLFLLRTRGL